MKGSAAALAALLLLALCSSAVAHLDGVPTTCCYTYIKHPVPRNLIASAFPTSSTCRQPGIVLVTKKGREICAQPKVHWVQELLERFQIQKN
ncbi:C-C motif chemokine 3-like [Numida meleagris]|uniref:C-C motif chemokine 3-like n=1 Tax=Numida meleagris TaxID=8996 RepID=UPI000B3DA118|nr:C-C motif chemokine 3-like [Numida meleagris]